MTPPCKSAADALAESPLAGLIDQARLLARVASAIAEVAAASASRELSLPPLRYALKARTVIITAGTPSQAAKLRQRAAAIEEALRSRVPEITGIRIRLQLGESADLIPVTAASAAPQPLPGSLRDRESLSAALRFAEDLSRGLHDSPLRRSAQRLQASLRARLNRDQSCSDDFDDAGRAATPGAGGG